MCPSSPQKLKSFAVHSTVPTQASPASMSPSTAIPAVSPSAPIASESRCPNLWQLLWGLKPAARFSLSQVWRDGRINYYIAIADKLRIGPVEFTNFPITVVDDDLTIEQNTEGVEGRISLGILADFLVRADYYGQNIRLDALPALPANDDGHGLRLWSTVQPGTPSPSVNGNLWGSLDRLRPAEMQGWTPIFGHEGSLFLLTKYGEAPERLFVLDMNSLHPRISTTAQQDVSSLGAMKDKLPGGYKGYFMSFGGKIIPIDAWVAERFDNYSVQHDLEISGLIDQSALIPVPFSIDYRDQLMHFESSTKK